MVPSDESNERMSKYLTDMALVQPSRHYIDDAIALHQSRKGELCVVAKKGKTRPPSKMKKISPHLEVFAGEAAYRPQQRRLQRCRLPPEGEGRRRPPNHGGKIWRRTWVCAGEAAQNDRSSDECSGLQQRKTAATATTAAAATAVATTTS